MSEIKGTRKLPKQETISKWKSDYHWLQVDNDKLVCSVCMKWNDKLLSTRNYSPAFINGSTNYRLSVLKDHDTSQMHQKAAEYENKERFGEQYRKTISKQIPENCPLKVAFKRMSEDERQRMARLFEVAYYVGHSARPYSDFPGLIELEKHHHVDLPPISYANENACKDFLHCIATVLFDETIRNKILRAKFVSVLCDGSTDASIVEKEVIFIMFVDPDTFKPSVTFFALKSVESQDAPGIKAAIRRAFVEANLESVLDHIVFLASDGASTNSGIFNGLIALMQQDYPWLVFIWCVSHRLELALKDSLKEPLQIAEGPLRDLYYANHRSSKKLRELKLLFEVLKGVYDFEDGQITPSKSCGTRWIEHKVRAMKGFVDKFGVYIQHLENVIADTSKASDKATLTGKVNRMKSAKVLFLCALFVDLLDAARKLSLQSQKQSADVLNMVERLDDTILHYELLHHKLQKDAKYVFSLPLLKSVVDQITDDGCYQGVKLTYVNDAKSYIENHICQYVQSIATCLQERYGILVTSPHSTQEERELIKESVTAALRGGDSMMHQACTVLDTRRWVLPQPEPVSDDNSEVEQDGGKSLAVNSSITLPLVFSRQLSAIEHLFNRYKQVLNVTTSEILKDQYLGLLEYATKNIECQAFEPLQLIQMLHKSKRHLYPDIFELIELCLCCPYTNAGLERFFSLMGTVKTELRNKLKEVNLEDLCRVLLGPTLKEFSENYVMKAVDRWYNGKDRRINQKRRKQYKKRKPKSKKRNTGIEELDLLPLCEESLSVSSDSSEENQAVSVSDTD